MDAELQVMAMLTATSCCSPSAGGSRDCVGKDNGGGVRDGRDGRRARDQAGTAVVDGLANAQVADACGQRHGRVVGKGQLSGGADQVLSAEAVVPTLEDQAELVLLKVTRLSVI